jgi:hypothetical protein
MRFRDANPDDFPAILELNRASVHFLSPLDAGRLARLHREAAYSRILDIDGRIAAFLIAFRESADYDSPNYLWFAGRYGRFLYIDRIVVREEDRGKGIADAFYRDLFSFAERAGIEVVTCEVDISPPNPVSLRFHRNRGFVELGSQWIGGGKKRVLLMEKRISPG